MNLNENQKQQEKQVIYSPLRLVGILTLIVFCTLILVMATFTRIKLINCMQVFEALRHTEFFPDTASVFQLKAYFYVPQVPVVLFTATLLGMVCGLTSVFLYIVMGLAIIPVFGLGGGFNYVLNQSFGYILAFIPAVIVMSCFKDKSKSFKDLFLATVLSVLTIHVIGFLYMLLISLIKHENFDYITDWFIFESLIKFVYDTAIGFFAVIFAKFCRKFIRILTAR